MDSILFQQPDERKKMKASFPKLCSDHSKKHFLPYCITANIIGKKSHWNNENFTLQLVPSFINRVIKQNWNVKQQLVGLCVHVCMCVCVCAIRYTTLSSIIDKTEVDIKHLFPFFFFCVRGVGQRERKIAPNGTTDTTAFTKKFIGINRI